MAAAVVAVVATFSTAVILSTETHADTFKKVVCLIPGTGATCLSLVNDLPWKFDLDSKKKGELSNIIYTSYEKVGKQAAILQLRLEVIAFASKKKAGEEFRDRYSIADPDMGLSYAWDFIAVQNMYLYHLHADCILAESNFISATDALTEILAATDLFQNNNDSAFFCRCGGPCRMLPQR
jgi:hypothetical protein